MIKSSRIALKRVLVLGAFIVGVSSTANAALITTIGGNDCSGVFGQGFANCKVPAQFDPNESPVIIKFNFNDTGVVTSTDINPAFSSITGAEFQFFFDFDNLGPDTLDTGDGRWQYSPGLNDPAITFYVAKGGPNFNLFSVDGDPNCGVFPPGTCDVWSTPVNPNNQQLFGLSHLTFYDTTNGGQVPQPTTVLLLGAGLLGAALAGRLRMRRPS